MGDAENGPFDDAYYERHFAELAGPMRPEEAALEAHRCLYCYDAPCLNACPTHIDVPRFIKQIASKNVDGAARTILEANALGHSCARVCPVEVLCEGACVYHDWHKKPIEIARLQRFATDARLSSGRPLFSPGPDNGLPVAVVGAGPAGLACAFYLRRLGHPVTVFERRPLAGGLNSYGVAEYKMTQRVSLEEVSALLELGADLRAGAEVGSKPSFSELKKSFSAVFLGVGLGATRPLEVPGEDLPGSLDALTFIEHVKNRVPERLPASRATVVVGGGNTAVDAATQSRRLGVPKVTLAYRRSEAEMGAYAFEVELARADGAELLFNAAPKRILGKDRVEGIEFLRTETHGGRLKTVPGSEFVVPCDRVIRAVGQAKRAAWLAEAGLRAEKDGRLAVDTDLRTSDPKVWAGGDAVNGGKEVVNAAADGKRAAWGIHRALTGAETPAPEHAYWVRTIEARPPAPIPQREASLSHG